MGFAAIFVADFMVQAVVRAEPELRDCAIALLEGTVPLRKVVAANDTALRAGIELGMTESQAEDFCAVQVSFPPKTQPVSMLMVRFNHSGSGTGVCP